MPSMDTIRYMHRELESKEITLLKIINGDNNNDENVGFKDFTNFMMLESYSHKRADKYMKMYNPAQPLRIKKQELQKNIKSEKKKFDEQELYFNQAWDILIKYTDRTFLHDNENYCESISFPTYFELSYILLIDFFWVFKYLKKHSNKEVQYI